MGENLTLIGMPGSGKSTTGIVLAKILSFGFLDTDVLIQINQQKSLQQIMDESDYLNLRAVEEKEILKINIDGHIIATGGSSVYSERAMAHLAAISTIVFLRVDYDTILRRVRNFKTRGIAKAKDQTFRGLYEERQMLYNRHAQLTFDSNHLDQEEMAEMIAPEFMRHTRTAPLR